MDFNPTLGFPNNLPANASLFKYSATTAGSFGAVAGVFALFFFSEVPKVRTDIMQVRLFPPFRLSRLLLRIITGSNC